MQVGGFGQQVGFRQGQTAGGQFQVHATPDAGADLLLDLLVHTFVRGVVFLAEVDQCAIAQNVQISPGSFKSLLFAGVQEFEITCAFTIFQLPDQIGGLQTLEQVLCQIG